MTSFVSICSISGKYCRGTREDAFAACHIFSKSRLCQDFVRIWVRLFVFRRLPSFVRVDPNITCENCKSTPLEIAALYLDHTSSSEELLCLLGEYTEMPDDIKFVYLKKMIDGSLVNPGEFEKTLGSLKIDMVIHQSSRNINCFLN